MKALLIAASLAMLATPLVSIGQSNFDLGGPSFADFAKGGSAISCAPFRCVPFLGRSQSESSGRLPRQASKAHADPVAAGLQPAPQ